MKSLFRKIRSRFYRQISKEDGAVTVDWVVLTAGLVGVAAGAGSAITTATTTLGGTVSTNVSSTTVDNGN